MVTEDPLQPHTPVVPLLATEIEIHSLPRDLMGDKCDLPPPTGSIHVEKQKSIRDMPASSFACARSTRRQRVSIHENGSINQA